MRCYGWSVWIGAVLLFKCSGVSAQALTTATSTLFAGSGVCVQCHTAGIGVFTTEESRDISPDTLWQSSMMANAARDPLWQAKVSAEVDAHPALQSVIEDKCATCHAPMGRTEAVHAGSSPFAFETLKTDPLSMDGVSCTLCHQVQGANPGDETSYSGGYQVLADHEIFGPYQLPTTMPMFNQTGFTPVYSSHVDDSGLCATCHTLFTPYVDNQGEIAGYFPEQTPYLEWLNSSYPQEATSCQTCHMPAVEEEMKISINPGWLTTQRSPVWAHEFVGGNLFMNRLLKTHAGDIGAAASDDHFDGTAALTEALLTGQAVALTVESTAGADTLSVSVLVENLTGHKFPTGFPSRQAWLHLTVTDNTGAPVFESGGWNSDGEINGVDEGYEPHHALITQPDQVQVYQAVMRDVDELVTHTLLRGATYAKDNRLPPRGFTSSGTAYESTAIAGNAVFDGDFNRGSDDTEGSGTDRVEYRIPVSGQHTSFTVTVTMCYQTIASRFADDLFAHETSEVTTFSGFYHAADRSPIEIASATGTVAVSQVDNGGVPVSFMISGVHPNPFNAATTISFTLPETTNAGLEIFSLTGQKIRTLAAGQLAAGGHERVWDGRDESGDVVSSGVYLSCLTAGPARDVRIMTLLK